MRTQLDPCGVGPYNVKLAVQFAWEHELSPLSHDTSASLSLLIYYSGTVFFFFCKTSIRRRQPARPLYVPSSGLSSAPPPLTGAPPLLLHLAVPLPPRASPPPRYSQPSSPSSPRAAIESLLSAGSRRAPTLRAPRVWHPSSQRHLFFSIYFLRRRPPSGSTSRVLTVLRVLWFHRLHGSRAGEPPQAATNCSVLC